MQILGKEIIFKGSSLKSYFDGIFYVDIWEE